MFGWFAPVCPCDPSAKRWVEERLRWLTRQFGLHILLERDVILPTEEFFPDPYDGSAEAVETLFRRVCGYMEVDPDDLEVEGMNDPTSNTMRHFDPERGFAAGTWQRGVIRLERGGFDRPADLIGTMAHELSHQRLLGEGRADRDAFDNELLTDLTAVFHGFGVFLANNPRKHVGELQHWPGTQLVRPEYISEPMLGYAMAHIAWHRDEAKPPWAGHLRWATRPAFKQGLRFLHKTNDSTFPPVRLRLAN